MTEAPAVHELHTRLLERKEVLRTAIQKVEVIEAQQRRLLFETLAVEPRLLVMPAPGMPRPSGRDVDVPGRPSSVSTRSVNGSRPTMRRAAPVV
jgi:hypothetical protein